METKKFSQKFKAMGIVSGIIGLAVIAAGITSALYCLAGVALIGLGVYLFIDDWGQSFGGLARSLHAVSGQVGIDDSMNPGCARFKKSKSLG